MGRVAVERHEPPLAAHGALLVDVQLTALVVVEADDVARAEVAAVDVQRRQVVQVQLNRRPFERPRQMVLGQRL